MTSTETAAMIFGRPIDQPVLKATPYQAEAINARNNYEEQRSAIRNDMGLTAEGRTAKLQALHGAVSNTIAALQAQHEAHITARRNELESRHVRRTSAESVSEWRDAADRVARLLDDGDIDRANELLRSSIANADTTMVKTILGAAVEQGLDPLIETYTKLRPQSRADLTELRSLAGPPPEGATTLVDLQIRSAFDYLPTV